jgi:radical SAM superfamily enzyme YgiQ (UPF0313 family)
LGSIYFEQGQIDKSINEFNQVLELNPQNQHAHHGLGLCYQYNKEFDKAIEEFKKVLAINPDKAFVDALHINAGISYVHQGLGSVYLEQGFYDLAREEFEKMLRLDAKNMFAHRMLGYIYKRQGQDESAVSEFITGTNLYLLQEHNRTLACFAENKTVAKVENREKFSVKIVRIPSFINNDRFLPNELNFSLLPPLALGQITAHLKTKGFKIDQDDLNIKMNYDYYFGCVSENKVDITVFFDENRIIRYLAGCEDKDLESIFEKVERKTAFSAYHIILLSLPVIYSNSSGIMFTLSLSKFLKKKYNLVIIAGGAGQSIELLSKYTYKDIDFIIYGDGEVILLKLFSALKNGMSIKGFFDSQIKKDSIFISNEVHPPIKPDFSGLPMDKYKFTGPLSSYNDSSCEILREFGNSETLLIPFKFIRSCPYECIFCASSSDKSVFVLEPKKVVLNLEKLQKEHNPCGFFFLSDSINISKQYVNELCSEIERKRIRILWSDCARADNLDRDILFRMRDAGCIRLIFGMETASARLLKYINKRISLKRLENILRWADEAGIWSGVEIICGLPHENDDDIEQTISFLDRNREYINTVYINQFDLREGSLLIQNAKDFGIENMVELNQYANEEFTYFHKYGYDEVGGLRWQDKRKQIIASHNKLLTSIYWNTTFPAYEFEHFLFFLYNKFGKKQQVYDVFTKVQAEKNNLLKKLSSNEKVRY